MSFKKEHQKPTSIQQNQLSQKSAMPQLGGDESWQIPVNVVKQIRNSNDLQTCLDIFLENLPEEKPDIKEAYSFTMTLPESYYGVGSYDKWIKTGFALKNINIYLLIVWLKFSSQSKTFDYNIHVDEICDHWIKFTHNPINGVKKKSLMYWSRIENPEEYKKIKEQTADYYIEKSLRSLTTDQIKLIKRYTPNITMLFDGDVAGIKASFRGIDMILKEGLNVKVVLFPDGEDPDSYSKN